MIETSTLLHLTPDDYHVIGPADFGSPGLTARESIGPMAALEALGPLVTVHDSTFEPHTGIGHHPHQRMERLFYILSGAVDHDDALNGITGHMATGDLGILTEGRRGMVHSERNSTAEVTRCYILVYPTEPLPETAAFDAIRDRDIRRSWDSHGIEIKHVVERGERRLHGDIRELSDSDLSAGAVLTMDFGPDECGLVFVVDGEVEVDDERPAGAQHTIVVPPAPGIRQLHIAANRDSRVLQVVAGPGFGLRRR